MEWVDEGFVLSARPYGEGSAILHALTRSHGRHAGLVRGGASSRLRGTLQPGNAVDLVWRARLADQLGNYSCELKRSHAAPWFDDQARLAAVGAACAVAEAALPEREPHPAVFDGLGALLGCLDSEAWPAAYVGWELGLLAELGFGLDLAACASTGGNDDLAFVSPRTGRAVSASAGEPWRDRLLPLPGFLIGRGNLTDEAVAAGLDLTGHFLERHVMHPANRALPAARTRLVDCFRRRDTISRAD